ncbi:hypothetical protein PR048_014136 [Dryococelus australis]|uniref:Uncharacterized protein n=1 Tax=Dryococelus australis TaxID=614101 RepID=A0ABQ9HDK6_9NEOP|nr:hypothetical protein PR048_014136 [Dryococelus australis]
MYGQTVPFEFRRYLHLGTEIYTSDSLVIFFWPFRAPSTPLPPHPLQSFRPRCYLLRKTSNKPSQPAPIQAVKQIRSSSIPPPLLLLASSTRQHPALANREKKKKTVVNSKNQVIFNRNLSCEPEVCCRSLQVIAPELQITTSHDRPFARCVQDIRGSGTIPIYKNPVTRPGTEPGSPLWEASRLTAQPPLSQWLREALGTCILSNWLPQAAYKARYLLGCKLFVTCEDGTIHSRPPELNSSDIEGRLARQLSAKLQAVIPDFSSGHQGALGREPSQDCVLRKLKSRKLDITRDITKAKEPPVPRTPATLAGPLREWLDEGVQFLLTRVPGGGGEGLGPDS